MQKVQEGCGVVGQFLLGEHQGAVVSPSPGWRLAILPQALPYKCLALPGPCAVVAPVTPARMPQARPCRPMRSGRQGEWRRCRHAWPHTPPSQLAGGLGLPGSVDAPGALCQALGPALRLSVEVCRGEASVEQPGVLCSLWALAVSMLLLAACKHKE